MGKGMDLKPDTGAVLLVAAILLVILGGCSNGGGNNGLSVDNFEPLPDNTTVQPGAVAPVVDETTGQPVQPDPATGGNPGQIINPATGNQIQSTNAALLTGASLDTITKLITAADIATAMVLDSADLITTPNTRSGTSIPVSQCRNSSNFGPENRFTFAIFAPGNFLPPGMNLNGTFAQCNIENALVSGFIDLSGITVSGVPNSGGDWSVSGILSFGSLDFLNDDGTSTSITNNLDYRAEQRNGILTVTLDITTLNVEHNLNDRVHINYLLEPFSIRTVENTNTLQYSISIAASTPLGQSLINRYTTNFVLNDQGVLSWLPIGDDIELLASADIIPLLWQGKKPDLFIDPPDGGEILLAEATGDRSISVVLDGSGVTLNLNAGATVTGLLTNWTDLLAQQ